MVELLVVVSIIIFLLAMAIPGISSFMKGRKLYNLGRLIESTFQRARMATVKTHIRHRVLLFQEADPASGPNAVKYGLRIFREGNSTDADDSNDPGYADDAPLYLPKGTKYAEESMGPNVQAAVPIADEHPSSSTLTSSPALAPLVFLPNGTLSFEPPTADLAPDTVSAEADLYDRNKAINSVPRSTRADIVVLQQGTNDRLYVDLDRRTDRARFRVVKTTKVVDGEGGNP